MKPSRAASIRTCNTAGAPRWTTTGLRTRRASSEPSVSTDTGALEAQMLAEMSSSSWRGSSADATPAASITTQRPALAMMRRIEAEDRTRKETRL